MCNLASITEREPYKLLTLSELALLLHISVTLASGVEFALAILATTNHPKIERRL